MNLEELTAWLDSLVDQGRMRADERDSLIRQRSLFDEYRELLESQFPGVVVGFVEDERIIAPTIDELLDQASAKDSPIYFENIPDAWPDGPSVSESTAAIAR